MAGALYIGTSGWSYDSWKGTFYAGVPRRSWLTHYASRFSAVEINASYYRLQRIGTYRKWHAATPGSFRFAVKANRYLTAYRRLREPAESIAVERERAEALEEKLDVVLWQFPASFRRDPARLQGFAKALGRWHDVGHALEFRHPSWFAEDVWQCLHDHGLAAVQSDAADWPLWDTVTADLTYVRLHGHTRTYHSAYSAASLRHWAERVRSWRAAGRTVHVYFDNTDAGAAFKDAHRLLELLEVSH